ncbi:MAG: histidine kinase [Alteromonadaceae bacterium]|nr:MAG: histidine kinase [Alteromonadaceae bacterium]
MILSAEITLYPFQEDFKPPIKATIKRLQSFTNITVNSFATATVLMGEYDLVMDAIKETMAWSHQEFGRCVFIVKFLPGYEALDSKDA